MAIYFKVILIAAIIYSVQSQCNREISDTFYKRAVYEFSTDLMKRFAQQTENHFVASPFSLWSLFSTLKFVSEGVTQAQLIRTLKLHYHDCFTLNYYKTIGDIIVDSNGNGAELEKSSAFFIDDSMGIKENFTDEITKSGLVDVKTTPFYNYADVASFINEYVNQGTRGLISDFLSAEDIEDQYVILIDALFFKGTWEVQFPPEKTEEQVNFYDEVGDTILGEVTMMSLRANLNTTYVEPLRADVLELPYGDGTGFSMLIFLPKQTTLSSVIESLDKISLSSVFKLFEDQKPTILQTQVYLPKFEVTTDIFNLKELLTDMGLERIFDPQGAELTNLSDYKLYVSNVIQKSVIQVSESGTVAGSGSAVSLSFRAMINEFNANKPFAFMIVHRPTQVVLFTGAYSKPAK